MKRYYGAVIAEPQRVTIKDNSTGVFVYGRSSITSVSLVSDSIYDQVIPGKGPWVGGISMLGYDRARAQEEALLDFGVATPKLVDCHIRMAGPSEGVIRNDWEGAGVASEAPGRADAGRKRPGRSQTNRRRYRSGPLDFRLPRPVERASLVAATPNALGYCSR